ncbi:hypothetical protein AYI68_g337 [Smittium mucronatum]|uniref:Restriction endonuclease type IV Mrr domain-containing protein n=1 Tax=Smittium mucronatum TaxID=133383 RepID=A0A1R0H8N7_9FUNG|nr:hypothetical protein AYI68_g337 [Smittium mucronatum]
MMKILGDSLRIRQTIHICRSISSVGLGTQYENLVVATLNKIGAKLTRSGGACDAGIDYSGPWILDPDSNINIHLIGQCKNYSSAIGPSVVREFEGVMSRQNIDDTVGVLNSPFGFSRKAIEAAMSSKYPLSLMTIKNAPQKISHSVIDDSDPMENG